MHQQGQSVTVIASNLGTSTAAVDGYLGISVPKQASTPAPSSASSGSPAPAEPVDSTAKSAPNSNPASNSNPAPTAKG
jgi:hypothetical protein